MRGFLSALAIAIGISAPATGMAQNQPVVVELYTSQGCSSCPPADAMLIDLAKRDDVIALALHVDYWDYIGWKDIFGDPAFTRRQKGYAKAAGHRTVYTPQMIIAGRDHIVGAKPMKLARLIDAHSRRAPSATIRMDRDGDAMTVSVDRVGNAELPAKMVVQLVRFDPLREVDIKRGENAGRTIAYANIVTDLQVLGQWDGSGPLQLRAENAGNGPAAVILQAAGNGPILAAAQSR